MTKLERADSEVLCTPGTVKDKAKKAENEMTGHCEKRFAIIEPKKGRHIKLSKMVLSNRTGRPTKTTNMAD